MCLTNGDDQAVIVVASHRDKSLELSENLWRWSFYILSDFEARISVSKPEVLRVLEEGFFDFAVGEGEVEDAGLAKKAKS